ADVRCAKTFEGYAFQEQTAHARESDHRGGGVPRVQPHSFQHHEAASRPPAARIAAVEESMKVFIFRCRSRPDVQAATRYETGSNLPRDECSDGWLFSESVDLKAERSRSRLGIDIAELRRRVQQQGYHVWGDGAPVRAPASSETPVAPPPFVPVGAEPVVGPPAFDPPLPGPAGRAAAAAPAMA